MKTPSTPKLLAELNPYKAKHSAAGAAADSDEIPELINGVTVSDVRLTAEEQDQALNAALRAKRIKIGMERLRTMEKIREIERRIEGARTPYELWNEIQIRGKAIAATEGWEVDFHFPDHSYDIYLALCYYFTGNEEGMMKYQLSPRKGLMLYGNVGVGKSIIMKVFARNVVQSYRLIKTSQIVSEFGIKDNAQPTIQKYSIMASNQELSKYHGQQELGCCFDDLGAEKLGKNYGSEEVMIDILENRYDNNLRGAKTHIVTNLSLEQIADRYGPRVLDRLRQMFNLIDFPEDAPSMRQ